MNAHAARAQDFLFRALRESRFEPRRREIEKRTQLKRYKPLTGIDETNRPGFRLEFLEHHDERASPYRTRDLVREHARDSNSCNGRINGSFSRVDDKSRVDRNSRI